MSVQHQPPLVKKRRLSAKASPQPVEVPDVAAPTPKAKPAAAKPPAPRLKRLVAVGAVVAPLLEPSLAKKGVTLARLLPHWGAICPVLAKCSYPEALRGDTLTVAVASDAVKQELLYMTPQVIESVNMLLGYPAIAKVKAMTRVLEATGSPSQVTPPLPPSREVRDRADAMCKHIKDDALRQALAGLGSTFQRKKKS